MKIILMTNNENDSMKYIWKIIMWRKVLVIMTMINKPM